MRISQLFQRCVDSFKCNFLFFLPSFALLLLRRLTFTATSSSSSVLQTEERAQSSAPGRIAFKIITVAAMLVGISQFWNPAVAEAFTTSAISPINRRGRTPYPSSNTMMSLFGENEVIEVSFLFPEVPSDANKTLSENEEEKEVELPYDSDFLIRAVELVLAEEQVERCERDVEEAKTHVETYKKWVERDKEDIKTATLEQVRKDCQNNLVSSRKIVSTFEGLLDTYQKRLSRARETLEKLHQQHVTE